MYGHKSIVRSVCVVIIHSKSKNQPGKVVNPVRGQLNREMNIPLSAFAPENLVPREGFQEKSECT